MTTPIGFPSGGLRQEPDEAIGKRGLPTARRWEKHVFPRPQLVERQGIDERKVPVLAVFHTETDAFNFPSSSFFTQKRKWYPSSSGARPLSAFRRLR